MSNDLNRPPVTLEALIRLKRAERPSAEFWTTFERELRQKQLSALVEKRAWWHGLPRWVVRHAYLPAGAAAALTLAVVVNRSQDSAPLSGGETLAHAPQMAPAAFLTSTQREPAAGTWDGAVESDSPLAADGVVVAATEIPVLAPTVPGDFAARMPWTAPQVEQTPSARSIADTLARLERSEPQLLESALGQRLLAPASSRLQPVPERAVVELASVSVGAPQTRRSNRLLVGYQEREFTPDPVAPDRVRERIARRLGDVDLLDEVRRVDVKADRLSLRL